MNTHAEYRRHGYRPPEPPSPQPDAEASELARHRDPALSAYTRPPSIAQTRVAWVRPTEMASYAGTVVGRGIDLQAELVRRARRAPTAASRAMRNPTPTAPPPAADRTEGLQL